MTDMTELLEAITGQSATDEPRVNDTKLKAFAWARVSTEEQEKRGLSIPQQLREMRDYSDKKGIEIIEEYHEAASAFNNGEKRVEFNRMIERAKADPEINAIIVHDLSRFSRDSLNAMMLVRELGQAGVQVISLNDPTVDPDTVAGVYMGAITLAKNEAQSMEIAFHTRKGCKANVQTRDPETGRCYKNGGQPLWGYHAKYLERGSGRGGRPTLKLIWELDDTIVAGRPLHEWSRHCLVELAAKGASCAELRDFCINQGLPGRSDKPWSVASWQDILDPKNLLQYCGYGVWNVRGKHVRRRPLGEWVTVPDAHPAIITEDEAKAITRARRALRNRGYDQGCKRSRTSGPLLSGGLFKCQRCGINMVSIGGDPNNYYICSSVPYRGGLDCGKGVYVPLTFVESEVLNGARELLDKCISPGDFLEKVNRELQQIWQGACGNDPHAAKRIMEIDRAIGNIRRSVEEGLDDVDWANARLRELRAERARLEKTGTSSDKPPQIDLDTLNDYRRKLTDVLPHAEPAKRKRYVRSLVDSVTLNPVTREIVITYRLPENFTNNVGTACRAPT